MFEFDPAESAADADKHGIDFVAAQALWSDPDLTSLEAWSMAEKRDTYSSGGSTDDLGPPSSPIAGGSRASSPSAVRDAAKKWPTSAAEFDQMFDDGEDIDHLIDWSKARLVEPKISQKTSKRVNIDFPAAMVRLLDDHAARRGVTRQALIKMWLADRLETAG